tara:strand:- start:1498 stop:2220 length:723 start_codon:yes stop_codon:yes gene_type:complete
MEDEKRTPEEIKADLLLKEAEIAFKLEETNKLKAETEKAQYEALETQLMYEEVKLIRDVRYSDDEMNHVYRFDGDVSSSSVHRCMKKLTCWSRMNPKCDIEVIFSSPGGSIIDGFELFDFIQELRYKGHKITTGSLGMAASMAGILLMAGDTRWIGHQSWMMIHRAAFGAIGKTYEVEDEVKLVKRIEDRILDIFTSRSKLTKQKIRKLWDRKDWWIDADECLTLGLVDEIRGKLKEYEK